MTEGSTVRQGKSAVELISVADAIADQFVWLDHQAEGNKVAVKRKALHHIEDAGQTEARTQTDYVGRFAIELLQNAHDACADSSREGTVRFVLTESALLVANEGVAFDGPRIVSLVRQGSSEKADGVNRRTIGYKGVGFSSVFEISDHPQVISAEDAQFQFDRNRASALVRRRLGRTPRRVAARSFPFSLEKSDLHPDTDVVRELVAAGAVTVIRLPIRSDIGVTTVEETILETIRPEALVFMPAVKRLELRLRLSAQTWTRREGQRLRGGRVVHLDGVGDGESSWLVARLRAPVSASQAASLHEPAWERVREAEFTVGLPWNKGVSTVERLSPIHVYFPTDEMTGRSILLHGDFVIDSRRAQIQRKGPAGDLNERFAAQAASALADLAQSACPQYSPQVCAALAMSGSASRFGEVFNAELVSQLRSRRLLRDFTSKRAVAPSRVRRITDLGVEWERRMAPLLARKTGLLKPDYSGVRASLLLKELDLKTMSPGDVAKRVLVPKTACRNEQSLALLQEWASQHRYWERDPIYTALKDLRILRDIDGELRRADEVVLSVGGGPALPPSLRRRQLAPVGEPLAAELIDELEVEHLDSEGALEILLDAIEEGRYGRKAAEHQTILRFCRALWQSERAVLSAAGARLGVIRLPARRANPRSRDSAPKAEEWVPATGIYLGAGWHPLGEQLERLYGPLGRSEFLAEEPPTGPAVVRTSRDFLSTLGAAATPRSVPLSPKTADRYSAWRSDPEVAAAWICDDGHPDSFREVKGTVLDRIDDLLARVGKDGGGLAQLLTALEAPYGTDAEVRCQNTSHRGAAKPRTAPGYQRWRLRRTAWVPVVNDPHGRRHRMPSEAWTGLPRGASRWLIPQAQLPDPDPSLELVSWSRPGVADVEQQLAILRTADADHPARDATADALLGKLEASVRRLKTMRTPVSVLALRGRERSWSDSPLIPDLPRLNTLDAIEVLPPGPWPGIRKVYGFSLASEVVAQQVRVTGPRRDVEPLFPTRARARLLALLARGADDVPQLAARLKRLREHPVVAFELRLSANGVQRSTAALAVHLVEQTGRRGRLPIGDLYWTEAVVGDLPGLVQVLSHYLQLDDPSALGFFLTAPDEALRTHGISRSEIEEAAELLRRRRSALDAPPAFEVSLPLPEPDSPELQTGRPAEPNVTSSWSAPGPRSAGVSLLQRAVQRPPSQTPDSSDSVPPVVLAPSPEDIVFGTPMQLDVPVNHGRKRATGLRIGPRTAPDVPAADTEGADELVVPPDNVTDEVTDSAIERLAVEYVCKYARAVLEVVEIRDVQLDNKGWDLEFVFTDKTEHLVEVKGSRGSAVFAITRNELKQARIHSNWVLYLVADLASVQPRMFRIDDFGSNATAHRLVAYQWAVIGWREMSPVEIPIRPKDQVQT
jgi:hypothetical protein